MNPLDRLEILSNQVRGWLPDKSIVASPHEATRQWWWQPTWSMGVFVAEVAFLNLIVPVSALGLPLFLVNMWFCFLAGAVLADRVGKKRNYRSLPLGPRWKSNMRRFVILPIAVVELTIGVAYFSVDNWTYVFTYCQTGNACTFFQLAPVLFLLLGVVILTSLAILEVRARVYEGDE
jgi:hypothetical protein